MSLSASCDSNRRLQKAQEDTCSSDNYSNYSNNHNKHLESSHSVSSIPNNTFSIDPTQYSTKGIHTKKSRFIGPNLDEVDNRSDSAPIESNVEFNWGNPSKVVDGKKIPIGASIKEYEIAGVINRRWNPNVVNYEYQFLSSKRDDDGKPQCWWSHHYDNALSACADYERYNFLKAVVQDHEFHEGLYKIQDSKQRFKVKINSSKSKTKRKKHYEKRNKKKQTGGPKQC